MNELVPFGKYRGRPVEQLLADQDYLHWINGQPAIIDMLQKRYPVIFNLITIGAPISQDTPEHNQIQAKFLNKEFQIAFLEIAQIQQFSNSYWNRNVSYRNKGVKFCIQKDVEIVKEKLLAESEHCSQSILETKKHYYKYLEERLIEQEKELSNIQTQIANLSFDFFPDISLDFECGFDVNFNVCYHYQMIAFKFSIEIKPQLGDDFPNVLRQMKNNGADTLLIGSFQSSSCSLDQIRLMFGERQIITLTQIENVLSLVNPK
jgi:hypothetical protein